MQTEPITNSGPAEVEPVMAAPQAKTEKPQELSKQPPEQRNHERNDVEFLQEVLAVAQNHLQVSNVGLDFTVHDDTGRIQVSVTDKETGDVIREIPSDQVLNLMAKLDEMLGILYDEKA